MILLDLLKKIRVGTELKLYFYTSDCEYTGDCRQFFFVRSWGECEWLKQYFSYPIKSITTNIGAIEIDLIDKDFKFNDLIEG